MKALIVSILLGWSVLVPGLAHAQPYVERVPTRAEVAQTCASIRIRSLLDILDFGYCIIRVYLIPLGFSLAILVFVWGIVKFIRDGDNEAKRKEGRQFMIYGVVSLFVMVSIWGIIEILLRTFGISVIQVPQLSPRVQDVRVWNGGQNRQ